jgi:fatty-acyl-CoA synthase
MQEPTPSRHPGRDKRHADFGTIAGALDYAALGPTGLNFYSGRGELLEALPYASLREQAVLLARRMLGAGLNPGDRIALIADSDGDFARAFFACQYAGLIPAPMPLPAAFNGREGYIAHLRRMIQSMDAAAAFCPAVLAAWLAEATQDMALKFAGTLALLDEAAPVEALPAQDPDSLAYLQFSSGSTRFPLSIAVTQRAFMANARTVGLYGLQLTETDRAVSWLPFYHDMGLVGFLLIPAACQMTVDIIAPRDFARRPLLWLDLISRNRATISYSPSFGYELAARRAETASIDGINLSTWRSAGIGGDMIRPNVLTRFAERFAQKGFDGSAFVPSYGMAEATLALSFAPAGQGARVDVIDSAMLENADMAVPAGDIRRRGFVVCGSILPGHEVEVRDAHGASQPERRVGRLFVKGPSLMTGYYGAPEETARAISADGWLDTGDLGYLLEGQIVLTGRAKDLIIIKGRNLWPQDLEWAAETDVAALRTGDLAIFSVDGETDEEVVALVQCRSSDPAVRDALMAQIGSLFRGRFGIEARIVLVPPHTLPQTSSGKLSRSRARAMYLAGAFAQQPAVAAGE